MQKCKNAKNTKIENTKMQKYKSTKHKQQSTSYITLHHNAIRHFYRTQSPYLTSKYRHKGDEGQGTKVTMDRGTRDESDKGDKSDKSDRSHQTAVRVSKIALTQ